MPRRPNRQPRNLLRRFRANTTVIAPIDPDGFFALLTERLARLPLA